MVDSLLVNDGSLDHIDAESPPEVIQALQYNIGIPPTGVYDDLTVAAVRNFQTREGISVSGKVDSATLGLLFPDITLPKPTTILMSPNVTVSGTLDDGKTVKLCQAMLNFVPTGYLDTDTRAALASRGYDLDTTQGIIELQQDINKAKLKEDGTDPSAA